MLRLLQMGPFKVLTSFRFYIQNSRQLSFLELPSMLRICFFLKSHINRHFVFLFGSFHLVYLHCLARLIQSPPLTLLMQCSLPPRLQTSYPLSAHFVSSLSAPSLLPHVHGGLSIPPASSLPSLPQGFSMEC